MMGRRHSDAPSAFGDLFQPQEALEPILPRAVRGALTEWLSEIWAADELADVGLAPRRRAIFDGPTGVGKTTLAHHLAARLGLPMLAVRPEYVISKYVGETGERLGRLFELASDPEAPLVLLLDEFDAYSRQRRRSEQASDDSRNEEVDTLLQRLEQHSGYVIAATNFAAHIDQAIWRRFDIHISLELPGLAERRRILARYLMPFGLPPGPLEETAEAFETATPALMRAFCEGLKRQIVLGPRLNLDMARGAVIGRILATVHPHPDAGKPRLWSRGSNDRMVKVLPWPLPRAEALPAREASEASDDNVLALRGV